MAADKIPVSGGGSTAVLVQQTDFEKTDQVADYLFYMRANSHPR